MRDLTDKQMSFAKQMAIRGTTQASAYRYAFDTENMKDTTVAVAASNEYAKPHVRQYVAELKAKAKEFAYEDNPKRWIKHQLIQEAGNISSNSGAMRIAALKLLGQEEGMFKDVSDPKGAKRAAKDIEKQLVKIFKLNNPLAGKKGNSASDKPLEA